MNVFVVLDDNGQRRQRDEGESLPFLPDLAKRPCEGGEQGHGDNGPERNISEEKNNDHENCGRAENCFGSDHGEGAEPGGDSFAAAEFQPDGEHVAEDGAESGECGPGCELRRARGGKDITPGNMSDRDALEQCGTQDDPENDGGRSFKGIEEKSEDAEGRRFAGNVRSADVAAARLADVFAAEDADQEIAEGDRSQEVAGGGDE